MALQYKAHTASKVLPIIMSDLLEFGDEVGSRNGRAKELLNPQIVIERPYIREITTTGRKANIYAQIAETVWVLAGRNDLEWLSNYLPRAYDYSDNGETWRGGYGPRLRAWWDRPQGSRVATDLPFDQLNYVVELLRRDPMSRRAVIAIYDPAIDTHPGLDIPCNDFLQFQSRGGELYLTVTTRSNDAMWGWSGINAFEWSALQEIVASMLGINVGPLTFNIGSLHLYEPHWNKASKIKPISLEPNYDLIRFNEGNRVITNVAELDKLIEDWFAFEYKVRTGVPVMWEDLEQIREPMFRSWAAAIAFYWTQDEKWLTHIGRNSPLRAAMGQAPTSLLPTPVQPPEAPQDIHANPLLTPPVLPTGLLKNIFPEFQTELPPLMDKFHTMVSKLHAEKHASYGDSWKKRGEQISILANIARKVDRLGVGDTFDSELDTVVDLLVYSIKYFCWLMDVEADPENVDKTLRTSLHKTASFEPEQNWQDAIRYDFNTYIDSASTMSHPTVKAIHIDNFIQRLTLIAYDVWYTENEYRGADAD